MNHDIILPNVEQIEINKQVKYFVVKRFFYASPSKEQVVEQWWLYGLKDGCYVPIFGTLEQDPEKVKKIFNKELTK